ncbi:preprotein translocase subunit SecE [Algicola sagamiensis]|uniref:preprotein translocase subunit SecE n=1 Tax=Algicola sagamiensis TaxID=163869 RepID=UPI00035F9344|nr:preprotein translocase subunit SecE [Algicola sagamiensis]
MTTEVENQGNTALDTVKWIIVIAILAATIVGNLMLDESIVAWQRFGAGTLVFIIAGFIASTTDKGARFISFAKESRKEVRKVVWPTQKETFHTTLIILAATGVMALILTGLDFVLVELVTLITQFGAK